MNILIVFGTRPEAIKLAPVVKALKQYFGEGVKVCVTGQHRAMLDPVLELFSIIPNFDLNVIKKNQSLSELTAQILKKLRNLFKINRPDVILVHGDTTTTLAASLAAFYEKIFLCHVEAGLRSENIFSPWPEELNRRVTTLIAQYHFAPTQNSAQNLLNEGVAESKIMVTGNTVIDTLFQVRDLLNGNADLALKMKSQFSFLDNKKKLILVTGHRRENFGDGFVQICQALAALAENPDLQIVYPVHLNPNVQKTVYRLLSHNKNIFLLKPLDYLSFVYLMCRSFIILTDSGGIQEEAPSLGKPVLIMREVTERVESLLAGTARLVGTNKEKIVEESTRLLTDTNYYLQMTKGSQHYGEGNAATKIANKIVEIASLQFTRIAEVV